MEHDKRKTTLPSSAKGRVRATVYPTEREVLLARLLLRVCDQFDWQEPLDEWLYQQLKPVAETVLRRTPEVIRVARETSQTHNTNEELTNGNETPPPWEA